jgi:DNA-binding NarL/FixJ family response regulator
MQNPVSHGIWVIEDHGPLRETVREALTASSLGPVETFGSCEAALLFLKTALASPEVVILDIGLPGMSGLDGLRLLKAASPTSEIIVFTVFDDRRRVYEAIGAGASGYLLKSESLERIIAAVGEVKRGGSPMTSEIARVILERFGKLAPGNSDVALSDREAEVLRALVDGLTKKEIASRLDLSMHTIDNYVRRIYAKLHVNTLGGAVAKALRDGLV